MNRYVYYSKRKRFINLNMFIMGDGTGIHIEQLLDVTIQVLKSMLIHKSVILRLRIENSQENRYFLLAVTIHGLENLK